MSRYRVSVDNSETVRRCEEMQKRFQQLPIDLQNAARLGAQYEKQNKTYTDRTGRLKQSTIGKLISRRLGFIEGYVEMGMPYASYVKRRGFSAFDDAVARTRQAIRDALDRLKR